MIKNPTLIKVSEIISNILNPLIALFMFFIYDSYCHYDLYKSIQNFLPLFFIIVLPTILWIYWNIKNGEYSDFNVSNRKVRTSLYFFTEICILIYLAYYYFTHQSLDIIMFFIFLLLLAMHISNYFIKSSMHTAFNIFTAGLFFSQNTTLGMAWLCISIIVGITRIILKRHTITEVISGSVIALILSTLYLYTNIQIFK